MITKKKEKQVITVRKFSGKAAMIIMVYAILVSLTHVWINSFSMIIVIKKNIIHLGMMMSLAFLSYPATTKSDKTNPTVLDWLLACVSLMISIFIFLSYDSLIARTLMPNTLEYISAVVMIFLILEAARRSIGMVLPILAMIFLLYARCGQYFPGILKHKGFLWKRILLRMCLTDTGVFGISLMVSASYVFMFIVFGAFLNHSGTARFFNDFAIAFAGKLRGGPAQVAVLSSGLMGTISGSAQANVATTGTFTIPLMKKVGYKPRFAAAVEAAASTGGILMPPIMGAASFVMASFLGIPYVKIMVAGIIPALFYYFSIFCMVDLRAQKIGLQGLDRDKLPKVADVIRDGGHMFLPILVVLFCLLKGFTPIMSAFYGIISTILFSMLRKNTRMNFKTLLIALEEASKTAITVSIACAVVGFIVGVVSMTGLGQVIALNIMQLSFGQLWLALILVMVATIILGMGLPSTACYIITASVAAPALVKMGVLPLVAHFFAFYYGTMSGVVPPVALTSYTAAGISGANPTEVAFSGFKLASAGLMIPFLFVYSPVLLMQDFTLGVLVITIITGLIGLYFFASAIEGYFKGTLSILERIFLTVAAICMIIPGIKTDLIGIIGIAGIISIRNFRTKNKHMKVDSRV